MAYLLDALAILVLVFCVWRGGRRGLVRTVILLVGCVLAALIANWLSAPIAGRLYDSVVEPRVEQSLVNKAQASGTTQVEIHLDALLGGSTDALGQYLTDHHIPESVTISFDDLSQESIRTAIAPVMQDVVRPVMVGILTAVVLLVLFMLLMVVVALLARLVNGMFKLPVLKQINRVGGWVVGALMGVFWMVVFAAVVRLGADCGLFGTVITTQTVEQSLLVSRMSVSLVSI